MASAKTAKGFALTYPFCGANEDTTLELDLGNLSRISCTSCEEEFSPEKARDKAAEMTAAWEKVIRFAEFGRELAAE
jgi:hypothetical protein